MGELDGRVALVTGAARGQGRSHAAGLAAAGADVIVCDICAPIAGVDYELAREYDLKETVRLVETAGRRAVPFVVDVRDGRALREATASAVETLGRLDILAANAGVTAMGDPLDISDEHWDAMIDVNLTGVWHSVRAVAPHMIRQGGGSIIVTSSIAALQAMGGTAPYSASKAGVLGLVRSLAKDLGPHDIRVNAVAPSVVETPMVVDNPALLAWMSTQPSPVSRHLLPTPTIDAADITNAIVWLASDRARRVTGVVLPVDAGHSIN